MDIIATGIAGTWRLALARMAAGAAGYLAPKAFGRSWVGPEGATGEVALITRAFAVRDFALGLGAFLAARRDAPVRGWLEAGLLVDAADALSSLAGPLPWPRRLMLASVALGGVAGGVLALRAGD